MSVIQAIITEFNTDIVEGNLKYKNFRLRIINAMTENLNTILK